MIWVSIDYLHVHALSQHLRNIVQIHVPAVRGVIESAVLVFPDHYRGDLHADSRWEGERLNPNYLRCGAA
jgi:hypothetical protein